MNKILTSICIAMVTTAGAVAGALDEMAARLFGPRADEFVFVETPSDAETYKVSADCGKIRVEGSTPSAMAVGLNRYLRSMCGTDVSWYLHDPVILPEVLPTPGEPLEGHALVDTRFFLNYCTYGYSMPYWGWDEWQRLIDWMALQGVNAPLAIAGQEAVWQRVWRSFGLDDETIRAYFTGPAHLPWHRMLNMDRWDGPLPQSYIDAQEQLQKKIVSRARSLGMKPVLPAFAGHVPPELGNLYPNTTIHPMSKWGGLDPEKYRSYFIDPSDALFDTIQSRFLAEQTRTFGTDHIYGLDPFNEIEPPSWDEDYLANASRRIYGTLTDADPDAVWLQMAWLFYYMRAKWTPERVKAYLSGVDPGKMIFLDYYCDFKPLWSGNEAFHGHDFIWCYLGNFGGNSFLVGDMDVVNQRADSVLTAGLANLKGIGGTLEGLDVNRHMHSYTLDKAWRHKNGPATPSEWVEEWARARGGNEDILIADAWQQLYRDIYHATTTSQGTLINQLPILGPKVRWVTNNRIKYDNDSLVAVWHKLIDARSDSPAHLYDVVNVGRQALGNHFVALRDSFTSAYERADIDDMRRCADDIDTYILDVDSLLGSNASFLLGRWLSDARNYGTTHEEADYFETNARHLITTWAQAPGNLNDYANRDLSGLLSSFYRMRWRAFTDAVIASVAEGREWTDYKEPFYDELARREWLWCEGLEPYPSRPAGDTKSIARALYRKYFGD